MTNGKKEDRKFMPLEHYRSEFPVTKNYVYLDHAGVAPVPLRVKEAIGKFLDEAAGKAYANYDAWMEKVEWIRELSAGLVGAAADEIAFVKNTSHGISIPASGLAWRAGDNVIVYEKEFPSNIYPWLALAGKGVSVRFIPVREDGRVSIADVERLADSRTRLITMSSVQSQNGFRIDPGELRELCRGKGILLLIDAIQGLGAVPTDVEEYGADFLSADGHKWLLAPEGAGIFYCRRGLAPKLTPGLVGWKSVRGDSDFETVEFDLKDDALRFEEGSQNVMGIIAIGAALELLLEAGIDRIYARVLDLGDMVISEAENRGFQVRTPTGRHERGGIVSFSGGFDPAKLREDLMRAGIVVNNRSGALRVSPHFYNTEEEIRLLFRQIDAILSRA